jgi:hypothetical protein
MGREDIQRRIGEINREINEEVGKTTLPEYKPKLFPTGLWIFAAVCAGWWLFGNQVPQAAQYHAEYGEYGLYAAVVIGAYALFKTVLWLFQGKPKGSAEYMNATARVRELQDKRRDLEMQLKELDAE